MKILIYGINFSPELTGIGKYSGEMSSWLSEKEHSVRVVTTPPYYPHWKVSNGYKNVFSRSMRDNIEITRCPIFVPAKPTAVLRIIHLISFSISSIIPLMRNFWWKPDLVILVIPTIFCSLQTILFAKITGAKSVAHIQDYEIDAMFDLSMIRNGLVIKFALCVERKILNFFDNVSTISEGMLNKARDKGVDHRKLLFFPNWAETERFMGVRPDQRFLDKLAIHPSKKIILYAGNMGNKQGLESVILVAKELSSFGDLHFLLVGEGVAKKELQKLTEKLKLNNLTFSPLLPYEDLPMLLASASCHLVIQRADAGDAFLPSKLTNILASGGNCVITAKPETSLGRLCQKYAGIGTLVDPESLVSLREGILEALKQPFPNNIAIDYANRKLNKENILNQFMSDVS